MMASKEKSSQLIDIYNTRAIASKKVGDYDKALESCDIAIRINPKDLTASNFKSFILKEKTDFEKAIEYSDGTFRIKPSYQMSNFDYFLKLPYLSKVSTIDLSNNQIDDKGAKVLADSLAKGEMPNLKKLHLEGNQLTDKGEDALINVLKNETVQDVIITTITLYEKYQLNINGSADKKMSILENRLERAKACGVDVDNVVVERTTWDWIKNKYQFYKSISVGWVKCMITYDDVESFAGERLLAKLSKKGGSVNNAKDSLLCYFEAENDALQTEAGVKDTKYQMLDVITSPELTGNIEALYDTLYQ
ncbi:MAG: hypothetical protein FJX70_04480 [Alphaproteobacteria bacterium]|nr:hypothetical protein [Alphaproteobacteria bacterium]